MSVSAWAVSTITSSLRFKALAALLQLIFVLEPGIEAFEIGPVPEHVGLFLDRHAARNAMLGEQGLADQAQHRAAAERRAPAAGERRRERLDHVEHRIDLALVAPERDGLGQSVGDDEKALRRQVLHLDRAAGRREIVEFRGDFKDRRLVVDPRPRAACCAA